MLDVIPGDRLSLAQQWGHIPEAGIGQRARQRPPYCFVNECDRFASTAMGDGNPPAMLALMKPAPYGPGPIRNDYFPEGSDVPSEADEPQRSRSSIGASSSPVT